MGDGVGVARLGDDAHLVTLQRLQDRRVMTFDADHVLLEELQREDPA